METSPQWVTGIASLVFACCLRLNTWMNIGAASHEAFCAMSSTLWFQVVSPGLSQGT